MTEAKEPVDETEDLGDPSDAAPPLPKNDPVPTDTQEEPTE